jgi:hypothetical protein
MENGKYRKFSLMQHNEYEEKRQRVESGAVQKYR